MGILSKIVLDSLTSGGIISKPPTQRVVEKIVKTAVVETVKKTTTKNRDYAEYGDVIGVKRSGYKQFGVRQEYLNRIS